MVRNKGRLVAQGYNQQEGINFTKTFASITRLEAIKIMLAFVACKSIKLFFQMNVNNAFLNGIIKEEMYVKQPSSFKNPNFREHVFKLKKVLYVLKQAPRAWYDKLGNFFSSRLCDNTNANSLPKNPTQHSKAKYIEIRYHFIHDYVQKGVFDIKFIDTNH
uniref:Retrovirus-related Pol polyprotein from transposon TNT 1-94 n=1 Tax=Cajanus cajan TaxID=3821 RepID=A0A151T1N8_CAJCA|nr:Retrovirus-related Pol polyprotein from transposon TNT 1-94 [Cajanus cajan]